MFQNTYRGKKIAVLGHTGFKGSWLSAWLTELGAEVSGYSLDVPTQPSHFEAIQLDQKLARHTIGDVRDLSALQKFFKETQPEFVFHLAAQAQVRRSFKEPKLTFDTNLGGTVNVLECLRETPSVRSALLITSDKCYENVEWEYGYRETDRLGGKDPYSASKAAAEVAFRAYEQSYFQDKNLKLATVRAGNVIGGGDWSPDRIVPDCIRAWESKGSVTIRYPEATRPWQHVLEPLSGYLHLAATLTHKKIPSVNFNFGPKPECEHTVRELAEALQKHAPGSWEVKTEPAPPEHEATLLRLNCDRALSQLGWNATLNFEETVNTTAQWYGQFLEKKSALWETTARQIQDFCALAENRGAVWTRS